MSIKKTLMLAALAAVFGAAAWAADETPAPSAHEHAGKACCRKAVTKAADGGAAGETAEAAKSECRDMQASGAAHCHKQADGSMKHASGSGCCCCCPMAKEKDAASAPASAPAEAPQTQTVNKQ